MQEYDSQNLHIEDVSTEHEPHVTGLVDTIIFRNEDNGYSVCGIDGDTQFVAVGVMPEIEEGDNVKLYGSWTDHPEYGRQYRVSRYESIMPQTEDGIISYLSSGMIKGIGPKRATRLVRAFGTDTLEILAQTPALTARIKGVSVSLAESIASQLQEKKQYQDLVMLLAPLGAGAGRIMRIYRKWGNTAVERIRHNPYCLAEEIEGTGFLTADRLAREMGIEPDNDKRLESAAQYWLNQNLSSGNTWSSPEDALAGLMLLADVSDAGLITSAFARLVAWDKLICCNEQGFPVAHDDSSARFMLPHVYKAERQAAERMLLLSACEPQRFPGWQDKVSVRRLLSDAQSMPEEYKLELTREQIDSLTVVISSQVSVLTGGPGTGKTTIIRALCNFIKAEGGRIILAAPTGRAARRLSETSGAEASTLHRLLALPVNGRAAPSTMQVNLQADFVVVDEASMLDVFVFSSLLEAVSPGTRLVLTGDADQLPSIGPGQVLRDLTMSDSVPVLRLTKIFRQSGQSLIVSNAHRIREGKEIELDQSLESSFIWINRKNQTEMADAAVSLCQKILKQQYKLDPLLDVQVLTPVRKGDCGAIELNRRLQSVLNDKNSVNNNDDSDTGMSMHGHIFMPGDKVIQLRNQYELEWTDIRSKEKGQGIMNGETGIIDDVNRNSRSITVLFDDERKAVLSEDALEDLDLAFAVTVHKSQGSEYPAVVLLLPPTAPSLLNRQLLYTAVTRAKKHLFIISSMTILSRAIANNYAADRKTMLAEWLRSSQGQC